MDTFWDERFRGGTSGLRCLDDVHLEKVNHERMNTFRDERFVAGFEVSDVEAKPSSQRMTSLSDERF